MKTQLLAALVAATATTSLLPIPNAHACTGITLKAADGAVLYGRTMEWGEFDLQSRVMIVPRGFKFIGETPDGKPGITWTAKYGAVGLDGLNKDLLLDGMNEKGLAAGVFFHPGFAEYQKYDPAQASSSLGPTQVVLYLLTTCDTVEQVRTAMAKIHVVPVVEPALGMAPPVHLLVTEPSGKGIVIEFTKGQTKIFDAPLGVITNAPNYDWHETNLRNYVNLSPVALPGKKIDDLNFKPLGVGSGMIGLPGDFTPPSRFVRAVAWSSTARPTKTGDETRYELFRILDNFNVPVGAEGGDAQKTTPSLRSSTLWTSGYDTKNRKMYYHTQNNRRIRELDLNKVDFTKPTTLRHSQMDKEPREDIEDITPQK